MGSHSTLGVTRDRETMFALALALSLLLRSQPGEEHATSPLGPARLLHCTQRVST